MAVPSVRHGFQSAKSDGVDPTKIQPSHWNADHEIEMDAGLIGRETGTGAAQVIGVGAGLAVIAGTLQYVAATDTAPATTMRGNATGGVAAVTDLTKAEVAALQQATVAQFRGNDAATLLGVRSVWDAAIPVTLTYTATITPNLANFLKAAVTLTGNVTLANPTNAKPGQNFYIAFSQDGTGSRLLTLGSAYKFPLNAIKTLSTAASSLDVLYGEVLADGVILCALAKGYA